MEMWLLNKIKFIILVVQISVFSENEMDWESLRELAMDNETAKELVPKVGPRLKLIKELKKAS